MWCCDRDVPTKRVPKQATPPLRQRSLLIVDVRYVVTSSTIAEMFKFDFIQDGGDERTYTVQNEKKEANEPALTEISLIELVRTPRLRIPEAVALIPSTVRQFARPHFLFSAADTVTYRGPLRISPLEAGSL